MGIGRIGVVLGLAGLLLAGCARSQHPEAEVIPQPPVDQDPPRQADMPPAPPRQTSPTTERTGITTPDESSTEEIPREALATAVAYYRLDQVDVAVVSREALDEHGLGNELAQRFEEAFSDLGMRVRNAEGASLSRTDQRAIAETATKLGADLLIVVLGDTKEYDRFGTFYLYEAEVRGTVYEPGGSKVATREITTHGDRSSDANRAAESALLAAADDLGPYLVQEIVRSVGQNVVSERVTISGLTYHASVMQVISNLRAQPGINDVRLLSWDEKSCVARLLVYLQPAARQNLGGYIANTPGLDVRIRAEGDRAIEGSERRPGR